MKKIWLLALIMNTIISFITTFAFAFFYYNNMQNIDILGCVALFSILMIPFFIGNYNKKIDIFSPLVIINTAYFLYLVYTPISDIITNSLYFGIDIKAYIPKGTLYSIFGILSMYLGYLSSNYVFNKNIRDRIVNRIEIIDKKKAIKASIIIAILSFISFTIYTLISGNSWIRLITFGKMGDLEGQMFNSSSLASYLMSSIDCFISLYIVLILLTKKVKKYTILFFPILLAVFTMGFRFRILIFIFAPIIFYYLVKNKRPSKFLLVICLIFIFTMIGVIGSVRGSIRVGNSINHEVDIEELYNQFMINNSIYQPYYTMTEKLPETKQFTYGKTFLYVFLHPIPRSIWNSKPEPPVRDVVRNLFNNERIVNSGMAYPNIGEFYVNFGLLGIVIGMFIFGYIVCRMYNYMIYKDGYFYKIKYSIMFLFILQYVSRGYFVQIFTEYVFLFLPLYIVKKISVGYKEKTNEYKN